MNLNIFVPIFQAADFRHNRPKSDANYPLPPSQECTSSGGTAAFAAADREASVALGRSKRQSYLPYAFGRYLVLCCGER